MTRTELMEEPPMLEALFTDPQPAPLADLADWWRAHSELGARYDRPIDHAVAAGFAADRVAYAFASGYQSAGRALLPGLDRQHIGALCVTEAGGAHPRAIETRLPFDDSGGAHLTGTTTFVTFGAAAQRLAIVATEGLNESGRSRLRLAVIDADRPGVQLQPMPGLHYIPEIPHAKITLSGVAVRADEVLVGDAYTQYVKPFRTVEDVHVYAAMLAYLFQIARRTPWPSELQDDLLSAIVGIRALAEEGSSASETHVALGALLSFTRRLIERARPHWGDVDPPTRSRWERDSPLLNVAGRARRRRLELAEQRLGLQ